MKVIQGFSGEGLYLVEYLSGNIKQNTIGWIEKHPSLKNSVEEYIDWYRNRNTWVVFLSDEYSSPQLILNSSINEVWKIPCERFNFKYGYIQLLIDSQNKSWYEIIDMIMSKVKEIENENL